VALALKPAGPTLALASKITGLVGLPISKANASLFLHNNDNRSRKMPVNISKHVHSSKEKNRQTDIGLQIKQHI